MPQDESPLLIEKLHQLHERGLLPKHKIEHELSLIQEQQMISNHLGTKEEKEEKEVAAIGADLFSTGAFLPKTEVASMVPPTKTRQIGRLVPGQSLCDRYQVLALIGTGGMGQVYLVHDTRRSREIAIKCLHPALQKKAWLETFHQELSINEMLTHPSILRTYDLEHDLETDLFFLTMEYVTGTNLGEYISQRKQKEQANLPVTEVIQIVHSIAEALDFAHQKRVIHQDLKPSNIMVQAISQKNQEKKLTCKLFDFGIASIEGTTNSDGSGTAYYMSPEQLRGESLTYQTDLYSLGVLTFQLLTGHIPQTGMPTPSVLSNLPEAVDPILLQMMHWKKEKRFNSACSFVSSLRVALAPLLGSKDAFSDSTETINASSTVDSMQALFNQSKERDDAFVRLTKRIDQKRPSWLSNSIPRQPPWSVAFSPKLLLSHQNRAISTLPSPTGSTCQRLLFSRQGIPLLLFSHIPSGSFWIGTDEDEDHRVTPMQKVTLDGYWISRTLVTNRIWSIFLDESQYQPSKKSRGTYYLRHWKRQPEESVPSQLQDTPVVWISFEDAWAFCDFYGLSLPTEAQWEKAARSDDQRIFPWGNETPTKQHGNFDRAHGSTTSVGMFGAGMSPFGLLDCAGNVFEWCANRWDAHLLSKLEKETEAISACPTQSQRVTIRGGHYHSTKQHLRTFFRQAMPVRQSAAHVGFRPVLDWKQ